MRDEERPPEEELGGSAERVDPDELLRGLAQPAALSGEIEERYLEMGRQLLADEVPRRLEEPQRRTLERYFGRDLRRVRIHLGERAQRATEALGAQAFALGDSDIFFGRGIYSPSRRESIGLLAHEVTHTIEAGAPGGRVIGFSGAPSATGQGEAQAEEAEATLAESPEDSESPTGGESAHHGTPSFLRIELVAQEAWEKLVHSVRLERERHGRLR